LKDFQARINNELADIAGNFINRTIAFAEKNFGCKVPHPGKLSSLDTEMILKIKESPGAVGQYYEQYRFRDGLMETMNLARAANKYFNDSEPWKTKKTDPEQCASTLYVSLQVVRTLAILLSPVIPSTSEKIWKLLKMDLTLYQDGWDSAAEILLESGHVLAQPEILIQKIEDVRIEEIIKFLEGGHETGLKPGFVPVKPAITIEDFSKIDLRVAKVLKAEKILKSEKLLKLQVDLGSEQRQILAGIAKTYAPEELIGKLVVLVSNLRSAKIMGQESQGMILAAGDTSGNLKFIEPSGDMPPGSVVQ
jgi:methionyl-tRNA synthetase